jgi:hypothetical protein
MIFPCIPCIAALLLPLLITEERKEREEFEDEEGRVVCWVREAELRLKFKIEDCGGGLLPANEPVESCGR